MTLPTLNKRILLEVLGVLTIIVGLTVILKGPTQAPVVSHPTPTTTVVGVPKITDKVIKEYITDPEQTKIIQAQLTEIKALKLQVEGLTSTIATNHITGGIGINNGTIKEVRGLDTHTKTGTINEANEPNPSNEMVRPTIKWEFKDFQLTAHYDSTGDFKYELNQAFRVVTITGRDRSGSRTNLVELYQDINGEPHRVPSVTTEIQQSSPQPQWWFSPRLQAGFAISPEGKGGVVGLQWARRGIGPAAEDSRVSFATVGLTISTEKVNLTLLPLSVNLGTIKHIPLVHDLWVSPTIDLTKSVGVAITSTF